MPKGQPFLKASLGQEMTPGLGLDPPELEPAAVLDPDSVGSDIGGVLGLRQVEVNLKRSETLLPINAFRLPPASWWPQRTSSNGGNR